jgi:hypothetical protein
VRQPLSTAPQSLAMVHSPDVGIAPPSFPFEMFGPPPAVPVPADAQAVEIAHAQSAARTREIFAIFPPSLISRCCKKRRKTAFRMSRPFGRRAARVIFGGSCTRRTHAHEGLRANVP